MSLWIIGDGNSARWHLAVRGEPAYAGHKNLRTRCTGKALYSTWGVSTQEFGRPNEIEHAVCARCDAMLAKEPA